jgi:hypothetical protein
MCCFCGGGTAATTIDHQPARVMFPNKHRPKGLEFPACATCNRQTATHEALVGLFARVTGNHRYREAPSDKALGAAIAAVARSFPRLLAQIVGRAWVAENGLYRPRLSINGNHAQVGRSAGLVAAKLGLAAYYQHFKAIAPPTVKINTLWTHNQNRNTTLAVNNLLRHMPESMFLQQGKDWDTQGSFYIRFFTGEPEVFSMMAILHESLALVADIRPATNTYGWMPWLHVWSPVPTRGIQPFTAPPPRLILPAAAAGAYAL